MDFTGIIIQILAALESLIPTMLIAVAVSAAVLVILLICCRGMWISRPGFKWMGLFFGLGIYDSIRLSASWIRFLLAMIFIIRFRELDLLNYFLFLTAGCIFALDFKNPAMILRNFLWLAVELSALVAVNMICSYMRTFYYISTRLWILYICFAMLTALLAAYSFLSDLLAVSSGRRIRIKKERLWINEQLGYETEEAKTPAEAEKQPG